MYIPIKGFSSTNYVRGLFVTNGNLMLQTMYEIYDIIHACCANYYNVHVRGNVARTLKID